MNQNTSHSPYSRQARQDPGDKVLPCMLALWEGRHLTTMNAFWKELKSNADEGSLLKKMDTNKTSTLIPLAVDDCELGLTIDHVHFRTLLDTLTSDSTIGDSTTDLLLNSAVSLAGIPMKVFNTVHETIKAVQRLAEQHDLQDVNFHYPLDEIIVLNRKGDSVRLNTDQIQKLHKLMDQLGEEIKTSAKKGAQ